MKKLKWESGKFPVGQLRTCDLSNFPEVKDGTSIWIEVHAVAGITKTSSNPHEYSYSKND